MKAKLSIVRGQGKGTTFQLNPNGQMVFGRSSECHVRFNLSGISRKHFVIHGTDRGYLIKDLGSSNGTFINGVRISEQLLAHHDIIVVGEMVLRFSSGDGSNSAHCIMVAFDDSFDQSHELYKEKIDIDSSELMSERENEKDSAEIKNHLKTLYKLGNLINGEANVDLLLEAIMDNLFNTLPFDRGALILVPKKNEKDEYEVKTCRFRSDKDNEKFVLSKTILMETINRGMSILSGDAQHDIRFKDSPSIILQQALKSIICAPLQSRDKILGAIYLDTFQSLPFSQSDLELLTAIGLQAGIALEKALLFEEVSRIQSYQEFVMEHAPVGIHSFNTAGVFTSWSRYSKKLFSLEAADVVGKKDLSFFFPEHGQVEEVLKTVEKESIFQKEIMLHRPNGEHFPCHVVLTRLYDRDGHHIGYTGYHLDMSRERELLEQLIRQEKMATMGLLSAGIYHDILNILSNIKGYANYATLKPEKALEYLKIVETNIDRASEIAKGLLSYVRKEALKFEKADITILIEEVLLLLKKQLYYNGITVEKEIEPLPTLEVIPAQIQEVFLNIIVNARDAMPQGGTLTISAHPDEKWVHFSFQDTGIGISKANMERIFEPFFSTKKKEGKGTGLGLSMSYNIIKKHGGKIEVESEVEQGSTFHVFLPIEKVDI